MDVRGAARALACICFLACGEDDSGDGTKVSPVGEDGPAVPAGGLTCGREVCTLPDDLEGETLCCVDPFDGGCGIRTGDTCRLIPKEDSRCPVPQIGLPSGGNAVQLFGCCTDDDQCGIDFMGTCQPRSIACNFVSKDQAAAIMPQTCDGEALPLPDVCGL